MKALVKSAPGYDHMDILEVPEPDVGEEEVLLNIKAVGVCGSDFHMFKGDTDCITPLILGHEFVGEIVSVGSRVSKDYAVGDMVVSEANCGLCGTCLYCRTGRGHMCINKKSFGYLINGGFAEYLNVNWKLLHHVPDGLSLEECCCIEPAAVIVSALAERTKIQPEDVVLVSGVGPIGLIGIQLARIYGASQVIATGIAADVQSKFPLAKAFGADAVIDVSSEPLETRVTQLTGGKMVDVVVECSGAASAVNGAINVLKKDGRICAVGLPPAVNQSIDYYRMVLKSIRIIGCFGSSTTAWDKVISLLARGALDLKPLVTHEAPLDQWRTMFDLSGKPELVKAVIKI